MTKKKKLTTETAVQPKNIVQVTRTAGEAKDDAISRTLTRPDVQAALTIQQWQQGDLHEINALSRTLSLQIEEVSNGNMKRPEAMLLAQAHTLDELFNNLARKAHNQNYIKQYEVYLRLALKAQSQCRTTLQTLAEIKNPPVIFAKQANIANNQQINNGVPVTASHAEEIKNQQNELLEVNDGERLDTRTTKEAIGSDTAMATLEQVHGR